MPSALQSRNELQSALEFKRRSASFVDFVYGLHMRSKIGELSGREQGSRNWLLDLLFVAFGFVQGIPSVVAYGVITPRIRERPRGVGPWYLWYLSFRIDGFAGVQDVLHG